MNWVSYKLVVLCFYCVMGLAVCELLFGIGVLVLFLACPVLGYILSWCAGFFSGSCVGQEKKKHVGFLICLVILTVILPAVVQVWVGFKWSSLPWAPVCSSLINLICFWWGFTVGKKGEIKDSQFYVLE